MGSIRTASATGGNFAQISNVIAQDKRLSFRARGIVLMVLSYPEGWNTPAKWIKEQSDSDGVAAIRTAMNELEEYGYLRRQAISHGRGKWDWEITFSDEPLDGTAPKPPAPASSAAESSADDSTADEFTSDENPSHETTRENTLFPQLGSCDASTSDENPSHISKTVTKDGPKTVTKDDDQRRPSGAEAPAEEELTAQQIISDYIDWCPERPPGRVVGQIAKHIGEMVTKDKIKTRYIKTGLYDWHNKTPRPNPSAIPSFVNACMNVNGNGKPRGLNGSTASVGANPSKFKEEDYSSGFTSRA